MRLPPLSVIIISQAIMWCIAGTVIHGWTILLYPAVWLALLAAFYLHYQFNPVVGRRTESGEPAAKAVLQRRNGPVEVASEAAEMATSSAR